MRLDYRSHGSEPQTELSYLEAHADPARHRPDPRAVGAGVAGRDRGQLHKIDAQAPRLKGGGAEPPMTEPVNFEIAAAW